MMDLMCRVAVNQQILSEAIINLSKYNSNFCQLVSSVITFASSLDPDQAWQHGLDLDPNCLTLIVFLKEFFFSSLFKKGTSLKGKNLLPRGSKFFPLWEVPYNMENHFYLTIGDLPWLLLFFSTHMRNCLMGATALRVNWETNNIDLDSWAA